MYSKNKHYCEVFTIEQIGPTELDEFMTYFMIRKVMSSKELLKSTGAVLSKFIKCLKENAYIDDKKFDVLYGEVNKNKDALPKVEELADLFFENGRRKIFYEYEEYEEELEILNERINRLKK